MLVRITNEDLNKHEDESHAGSSFTHHVLGILVAALRDAYHELDHPNYMYGAARIHRQAITCRDADIKKLRDEVRELKGQDITRVAELKTLMEEQAPLNDRIEQLEFEKASLREEVASLKREKAFLARQCEAIDPSEG